MKLGEQIAYVAQGMSLAVWLGKDNRVYYFLIHRQSGTHRYPDIPRYTDEDAITLSERYKDARIIPGVMERHLEPAGGLYYGPVGGGLVQELAFR
jgi:hypothetical protein